MNKKECQRTNRAWRQASRRIVMLIEQLIVRCLGNLDRPFRPRIASLRFLHIQDTSHCSVFRFRDKRGKVILPDNAVRRFLHTRRKRSIGLTFGDSMYFPVPPVAGHIPSDRRVTPALQFYRSPGRTVYPKFRHIKSTERRKCRLLAKVKLVDSGHRKRAIATASSDRQRETDRGNRSSLTLPLSRALLR